MAIISYPYTSVNGDRKVTASQMAEGLGALATSGVSTNDGDLLCSKVDDSMEVSVAPGKAFIAGHPVSMYAAETKGLDDGDTMNPRIDIVVLESNSGMEYRNAFINVVKGVPATSPDAPSLTQTDTQWQTPLCSVYIPAGAANLNTATLTDMREFSYGKHKHKIADLDDGIITSGKLANNAVTTAKINDSAVTATVIADGAVTGSKIATNAVTTTKIASAAVTADKIATGGVTMAKLGSEIINTSLDNASLGTGALAANTTGSNNIAVGMDTLAASTTGYDNTAIGYQALKANTTGYKNTAVGKDALVVNTTGHYNTAIGLEALKENIDGYFNVAIGEGSMGMNHFGSYNTAIGSGALCSNTQGFQNVADGWTALRNNTLGERNTAVGNCALFNVTEYDNCTGLGYGTEVTGENQVQLGNSSTTTYAYGSVQNRSDERDKADIEDTKLGLDFILALKPREFRWDYREDYKSRDKDGKITELKKDGSKKRSRKHQGFIAQEVKKVMDKLGVDFAGYQDHSVNGGQDVLSLGYTEFIARMVKAIQEQQRQIEELKEQLANRE